MDPTILSVIGVGVVLAALIVNGQRASRVEIASIRSELRTEIAAVRTEIASVRTEVTAVRADIRTLSDRVARLEGAFAILAPAALPALPKKTEHPA